MIRLGQSAHPTWPISLQRKSEMPQVRVRVVHQLERDAAIVRLRSHSQQMKDRFGGQVSQLEEVWSDDGVGSFSFRAFGFQVTGTTTVQREFAEVEVQLPFAAIPLRGLIEKEIAIQLENALADESM